MSLLGKWCCPYCGTLVDNSIICCSEVHMIEITEINFTEALAYLGEEQ
jgi:hypothetical protein